MEIFGTSFQELWTVTRGLAWVRAAVLLGLAFVVVRLASRVLRRASVGRLDAHQTQLLARIVTYTVWTLFLVSAMREVGFKLHVLLGAAGVLTVAAGFASQTSASNLISGIFLIAERPFGVGDVIRVAGTTGEVLSIDLLSVKVRTMDNLYVRLPNESLIKSEITNLTRFDIRRLDLMISVAYKEDLEKVSALLMQVAEDNPLSLEEPKPLLILQRYADSGIELQFSVWASRHQILELRNSIHIQIKRAFDAAGVEIPFPHRTLVAGSGALPVQVVESPRA